MNRIFQLTQTETERQKSTLNLIAAENYPSPKTLGLLGSLWNDKYAEGYPGKRYYGGNVNSDTLEEFVCQKALEVFDSTGEYGINVQPLSGSPANATVYLTVLEPGDTVLSLNLASGGHLSHMHATSNWLKFFKYANYSLLSRKHGSGIDEADFVAKLKEHKPRLTIIGFSSYPRKYEFAKLCKLAHDAGSLVMADISHIAGLVAAGLHDSPFKKDGEGADFVTTTTHKTLRGPRSALIFAKQEYMPAINKTIFPGTSGGPHLNQIAAVGQSLLEVLGDDEYPDKKPFEDYAKQVIANTKALENGLVKTGVEMVSPTQNHLCLAKVPDDIDSLELQTQLEEVGIVTNRNAIPNDTKSPWRPGGLRLGMAALTSRGISTQQAEDLGELIGNILANEIENSKANKTVVDIVNSLHWYY